MDQYIAGLTAAPRIASTKAKGICVVLPLLMIGMGPPGVFAQGQRKAEVGWMHPELGTSPKEALVNCTVRGTMPIVGVAVKSDVGAAGVTTIRLLLISVSFPPGPVAVS